MHLWRGNLLALVWKVVPVFFQLQRTGKFFDGGAAERGQSPLAIRTDAVKPPDAPDSF